MLKVRNKCSLVLYKNATESSMGGGGAWFPCWTSVSLPSLTGPCDVMSGSVASLYDPIRVPFRTCALEGKYISHKIWIRMYPIGKARMHCVDVLCCRCDLRFLYSRDISCSVECTELFLTLCFSVFKAKVMLLLCRWRQRFTPKRHFPSYKDTWSCNPKGLCTEKILTARILSRKILSERICFVDPFPTLSFERCYTLAKREVCLCGIAATVCFTPSKSILI